MNDRQLIADLLSALEYHVEQTRPIHFSTVAIEAARDYLKQPATHGEPVSDGWQLRMVYFQDGEPTMHKAVSAEPAAWKHDCAALCTNDVELWVDRCPHCGKPRQPVTREPSLGGVLFAVEEAIRNGDCPWQIEQAFDEYEAEPESPMARKLTYFEDKARAALAEQPAEQEPVASIYITPSGEREFDDWRHDLPVGRNLLYTAPQPAKPSNDTMYLLRRLLSNQHTLTGPEFRHELEKIVADAYAEAPQPVQRKPLTDEEIDAISDDHRDWEHQMGAFRNFARAIEAAHGIGGTNG